MDIELILNNPKGYANSRVFKKNWPDEYEHVIKYAGDSFAEKLYLYMGKEKNNKCKCCGKKTKFKNILVGYNEFCSSKCASRATRAKVKQTCIKKYGVTNPNKLTEVREKIRNTCLECYGVCNLINSQKAKDTMLKKYGVINPMHSIEIKSKIQKTNLEKYGSISPFGDNNVIKKSMVTKYNEYGDSKYNNREKFIETVRSNFIEKNDDILGYTEDGDWICKCPHPGCNQCKGKTYGTHKESQPCYGTHKESQPCYITNSNIYWDRSKINAELCTILNPLHSHISSLELKIRNWLTEMGVNYTTNDRRFGSEMDIYIPSLKLAIEVNGSYWHSTQHKTSSYHINKSLLLSDHGIRCIFVWDDYKETDIREFLEAVIKGLDLSPWIKKWFSDIKGWPADFGLVDGQWQEHRCIHGEYECYDAGVFV